MVHIARLASKVKFTRYNLGLAAISALKGIQFYQFTPDDVDYDEQTILGTYHDGENWKQKTFPYPDYIYDRMLTRGRKHQELYKSFQDIPFSNEKTPSGSLSKKQMYDAILKGKTFKDYLIPFEIIRSTDACIDYLHRHHKIICKPDVGSEGRNVLLIEKKDTHILVNLDQDEKIYSEEELVQFLNNEVFHRQRKHVVQSYIQSRTNTGNPFDIRVTIMKNRQGKWAIVKSYARIGNANGIVSNIAAGGSTCDLGTFTQKHINLNDPIAFRKGLRQFASQFANHIEKQFDFHFAEMGLDVAIDEDENLWLFEVNMNRINVEPLIVEAAEKAISYGAYVVQEKNRS